MSKRRQNTKFHTCSLIGDSDDMIKRYVDSGAFIDTRRNIKRFFLISIHHPLTRIYIKSMKELRYEEKRHLHNYFYMIHPLSQFHFWWKFIVTFSLWSELLFFTIIMPYVSVHTLHSIFLTHNVILAFLIIFSFWVGYYDQKRNIVVLQPRKVAVKYLSTYFIFDVIALGSVVLRELILHNDWKLNWHIIKSLRWALYLVRYARYPYYLQGLEELKLHFHINHFLFMALKNVFNFFFCLLFINCCLFTIFQQFRHFRLVTPIRFALSSAELLFGIDYGGYNTTHMLDRIMPSIGISFGFIIHLVLLSYVRDIWVQYSSSDYIQSSVYDSLGAFMRYNALPNEMRRRIFLYLDFKYQRHYYKESSVIQASSYLLRKEVLVEISRESTKQMDLFKNIPDNVMEKLRARFVPVIFLPNDLIVKKGTQVSNSALGGVLARRVAVIALFVCPYLYKAFSDGLENDFHVYLFIIYCPTSTTMFFLINGTVKIINDKGEDVLRYRDGASFGEISLLLNLPRVNDCVAVTPCEFYVLNQKHILQVLSLYPKLHAELKSLAKERLQIMRPDAKAYKRHPSEETLIEVEERELEESEDYKAYKFQLF